MCVEPRVFGQCAASRTRDLAERSGSIPGGRKPCPGIKVWFDPFSGQSGRIAYYPRDMSVTNLVKDLLDEVDVRLSDHMVVSPNETVRMAARGLI